CYQRKETSHASTQEIIVGRYRRTPCAGDDYCSFLCGRDALQDRLRTTNIPYWQSIAGTRRLVNNYPAVLESSGGHDHRQRGEERVPVCGVRGEDLIGSNGITAPYDAIGSYRRPLNYTVTSDKPVVRMEADLLLDTGEPKTQGEFFSLTIAARRVGSWARKV